MLWFGGYLKGLTFSCVVGVVLLAAFAQNSAPDPPDVPSALPRDHHDGLTLAADAYSDPGRCKDKFAKANPCPVGILPVEIFLRNETNEAVKIDLSTLELTVHAGPDSPQNLDWLEAQDVATAIAYPKGPKPPHASRLPLGIPTGADKKVDNLVAILKPLMFDADVLPPLSLMHGFLFFNVNRDFAIVEKSSVYLPDAATIPGNKALLFFEVPLAGARPR